MKLTSAWKNKEELLTFNPTEKVNVVIRFNDGKEAELKSITHCPAMYVGTLIENVKSWATFE